MDLDLIKEKAFSLPIQLRLADTDSLGHINNVSFIAYLETARTEWYAHARGSRDFLNGFKWDWILGEISVRFMKEVLLSDQISVFMWCSKIGTKSWQFSYLIINQRGEIVAKAKTSQICFDYITKQSMLLPPEIVKNLNSMFVLGEPS